MTLTHNATYSSGQNNNNNNSHAAFGGRLEKHITLSACNVARFLIHRQKRRAYTYMYIYVSGWLWDPRGREFCCAGLAWKVQCCAHRIVQPRLAARKLTVRPRHSSARDVQLLLSASFSSTSQRRRRRLRYRQNSSSTSKFSPAVLWFSLSFQRSYRTLDARYIKWHRSSLNARCLACDYYYEFTILSTRPFLCVSTPTTPRCRRVKLDIFLRMNMLRDIIYLPVDVAIVIH